MKTKKIFILMLLSTFLQACDSPSQSQKSKNPFDFVKVKVINHTPNHFIKKERDISDSYNINQIKKQLNLLIPVENVNSKSNKGLYELILYDRNNNVHTFDIIYTVYDGVVISDENTNKNYKNNNLESLILTLLQK